MQDRYRVAFRIKRPWPDFIRRKHVGEGWFSRSTGCFTLFPTWMIIWHKDPRRGGDDDSCNFLGYRKTPATGWTDVVMDCFNDLSEEEKKAVNFMWWAFKQKLSARRWWQHPKYHIWHWEIRISWRTLLSLPRII